MKQMWRKKKLLLGSQKNVIEFADLFHFALPFLVVVQPLLHHHPLFWPNTELAIAAARLRSVPRPYALLQTHNESSLYDETRFARSTIPVRLLLEPAMYQRFYAASE